jgi:hypothetical protein
MSVLGSGRSTVVVGVVALGGVACLALPAALAAAPSRAADAGPMKEHVTLKLVKRTGSSKFEHDGRATGTVQGPVVSKIALSHSVVMKGTVTISSSRGKLRLSIDGRARSIAVKTRFNGTATVVGGTGRYAHAKGKGTFAGVIDRSNWNATIDASGSMTF